MGLTECGKDTVWRAVRRLLMRHNRLSGSPLGPETRFKLANGS
jgi:hypothetical protein